MESGTHSHEERPCVGTNDLSDVVQRILASPPFQRAHRLSELLQYLCEHTLAGNAQAVKENAIGRAIFGRPVDYNAADDNIVRANMRQLRIKLDEFYQSTGSAEAYRLTIPKGSYALKLVPNIPAGTTVTAAPAMIIEHPAEPALAPLIPAPRRVVSIRSAVIAGIVCLIVAAAAYLLYRRTHAPTPSLMSQLMPGEGQKVMVIGADSGVQLYRDFAGHPVLLEDYISRRHLSPERLNEVAPGLSPAVVALFRRQFTETFFAGLIPSYARVIPPESLSVPLPDTVTPKDFERDHAVLISGPLGNPWVQLFDRSLNFQIEADRNDVRQSHLVNRRPVPGELPLYENHADASHTVICYARLAYLPGRSPRTRVLLAGGPHSASTQAASQFLLRPELLTSVRQKLSAASSEPLPWFEAVVEASAIGVDPWAARIVAIRRVESQATANSQ